MIKIDDTVIVVSSTSQEDAELIGSVGVVKRIDKGFFHDDHICFVNFNDKTDLYGGEFNMSQLQVI